MLRLYPDFQPKVSVILTCYNRAGYLRRSIDSVLSQTFKGWELVVVDDGSEDLTFDVVDPYLREHPNIRYLKHRNRKLALTQNVGIQSSVGTCLAFLDSDDEYLEDHLRLRFEYLEAHPDVDLLHGGAKIVGRPWVPDRDDLSRRVHLSTCVIGGTFFGRRHVFLDLGGFKDLRYAQDSEFFDRAARRFQTAKVSYPTYVYHRDTPASLCNELDARLRT